MALRLKANRRFPSIPVVVDDPANHTQVLMAVKEALDIGQRRTSDLLNSFIRVEDLIDLGLITIEGNTNSIVGADLSQIANIGDLSGAATGDFLRFDGNEWVNDQLTLTDITQAMVTQHQAALSIAYGQITGAPSIPPDISSATFITADDETATLANSLKLVAGSNVTFDDSTPGQLILNASGSVSTVSSGTGISVNNTDPENPIINLSSSSIASLALADSAMQPGDNVSDLTNDAGYLIASDLAAVALSGDYDDLINTPTIPPDVSAATFITASDETSTLSNSLQLTGSIIGQLLYPQTTAEQSAGVTPSDYSFPPGDIRRYGAKVDGSTDDSDAFDAALSVGGDVIVPTGTTVWGGQVSATKKARIIGQGPSSVIKFTVDYDGKSGTDVETGDLYPLHVDGVTGFSIENVSLDGGGVNYVPIRIEDSNDILFQRITVQNFRTDEPGAAIRLARISGCTEIRFRDIICPYGLARIDLSSDILLDGMVALVDSDDTVGECIDFFACKRIWLQNVYAENFSEELFDCGQCQDLTIRDCVLVANGVAAKNGLTIKTENDTTDFVTEVRNVLVDNVRVEGYTDIGVHMTFTAALTTKTNEAYNIRVRNCELFQDGESSFDESYGIRLAWSNTSVAGVHSVWIEANRIESDGDETGTAQAIAVTNAVPGLQINGNYIKGWADEGIRLTHPRRTQVRDNHVESCGGVAGIYASTTLTNHQYFLTIEGNTCIDCGDADSSGGIRIAASNGAAQVMIRANVVKDTRDASENATTSIHCTGTDLVTITDNNVSFDNGTPSITITGATTYVRRHNFGFLSENGGVTSSISTGTTVNHGLPTTPTVVQVTALAAGPTDVYVSDITSTTFKINFGGGGSAAFAWEAKFVDYYP